jgi:dTDP-glucose pyrophosphorylase
MAAGPIETGLSMSSPAMPKVCQLYPMKSEDKRARLANLSLNSESTLHEAFKKMDAENIRLLCVLRDEGYLGLLSAGDIQRAIIANRPLDTQVGEVLRKDLRVAYAHDSFDSIKAMMLDHRTEFMPVLDERGDLVDVHFWDEVFPSTGPDHATVDLPVVVMAGGKGTRLKPFSNILPKPLFPLGEKTILEAILDRFQQAGCQRFYLSVNHKADFIRNYLDELEGPSYDVRYFQEDQPLGTAGSLHLIENEISETFFVSNCDIVIDTDYSEIVDYHREHGNEITLVAALKHVQIPYGTLETGEGGVLKEFREKPELTYLINTGMYVLEPGLLAEIPKNKFFHITDLIEQVQARGGRVGVFPVSEKSWCDIGEWQEYGRTMRILGLAD